MNRYKSDDTCEALRVARALPAPAGQLWKLWRFPLAAVCIPLPVLQSAPTHGPNYPLKCISAAAGGLAGLSTVCSVNWREDCRSEEAEIQPL